MMTRYWTKHRLSENMLKLLAIGKNDLDAGGDGFCGGQGAGHGSASGRFGLHNRGLVHADHTINHDGIEALAEARAEGW